MGRIDQNWLSDARCNEGGGSTVEGWIAVATNAREVSIDPDGAVAVDGRYLDQAAIDNVTARIDRGV